jgi:hypothetical protein
MSQSVKKRFKLPADQIRALVRGHGGCIASDKITVAGQPVAYMIREDPARPGDSGWIFTSGTETQEYMDDAANFEVYDVNTIANYDPDIIPFLYAPPGSSFERRNNRGPLVPCEGTDPLDDDADEAAAAQWPPPGFPLVEGVHALTKSWSLTLPGPFARRVEDGALVLWRPGITLWIVAYHNDHDETQAARLAAMRSVMSSNATNVRAEQADGLSRLTYQLVEDGVGTLMALVFSDAGHLQVAVYFDELDDAAIAEQLAASISAT